MSLISESLWERIKETGEQLSQTRFSHRLVGVQGAPLQLCGSTKVQLEISELQKVFPVEVLVVKVITNDVILGRDFLQGNQCEVRLDCKCNQLHFVAEKITVNLGHQHVQWGSSTASVGGSHLRMRWR